MTKYYVKPIQRDWQPIEAESVEAAAKRYVAEYTELAKGSTCWIDLVVRGPEGESFFPREAGEKRAKPRRP
jgi:hypothetical protein